MLKAKKSTLSIVMMSTLYVTSVFAVNIEAKSGAIANDLNSFFNKIGFSSNVTGSHSYESQAAGFVSMGSIYARSQPQNIQVIHVDAPGFRSGCAGIDLYAGGFSYIDKDQIVKFMQSILSSTGGYALNLALETELPEMAHAMQFTQKLAADLNNNNLNSCELGEVASASVWPKNRAAHQRICEDLGKNSGAFSDWAMARQKCSTGGELESKINEAKTKPEYKDQVLSDTNIVWDVLQKNPFLKGDGRALKELYMSISGTIVFDKKGALQAYPSLVNNQNFIKAMLYGGEVPSYQCDNDDCLIISPNKTHTIGMNDALVSKVQIILERVYNHIKQGTAFEPEERGIMEMVEQPVFNLISASAAQNIGIQSAYELSQTIATDLLAQYLSNSLQTIHRALLSKDMGAHNEEKLFKSIQTAQTFVDNFGSESRERFNAALQTNQLVQDNVKQAFSALNPMLRSAYQGEAS